MKHFYSSIILIIFLCAQPVLGQFSGGDGSSGNPYLISSASDLNGVRNYPGDATTSFYFLQTTDIDLGGYSNWEPIGGGGTDDKFQGHYDGAGYTISNLTINRPTTANVGLFGHIGPVDGDKVNYVSIKNVRLENVDVKGARGTGALVGRVTGNENTLIESCYVFGGSVTGDAATGGLVGSNNSYVAGSTTSRRPVINKCFANVEVFFSGSGADNQKFGGLAGCNQKGVIKNSFSLGTVTVEPASGTAERVGGLAGCITLIGLVENSYSAGLVTVNGSVSEVGGLVGSVGTENAGTVTSSYWDTETSGQSGSAGGTGATTADMRKQATFSGWDFSGVWNILEDESYPFHRDVDLSGFDITESIAQTAGEPFDINITNAVSVEGHTLNGAYSVVVTSDIGTEGPMEDGIVYDHAAVSFSNGDATLEGAVLKLATSNPGHILTVDIVSILEDMETEVPVAPADAYKLQISQQPAATIYGNYDDEPAGLGTIEIITLDEFDNISTSGLDAEQLVTVTIENIGSPGNDAVIGGTTQVDIQSGTATFNNINIDKEGEGYTLRFSSGSPVALQPVISELFDIENIDDLSEFAVALEDVEATIYEFLEFGLSITGALSNNGEPLSGLVNVIVTGDLEGVIHNLDVDFTGGAANLFIALEELGSHILAVNVSGIKEDETLEVTVYEDLSEFAFSVESGTQYSAFPFELYITGATDRDGNIINSLTNVVVVSNIDGEVYNGNADIDANGDATIIIALSEGVHTLTVNVEGITHDQVITDLTIAENESGFIVAEVVGDKTAGVGFNLVITEAKALDVLIDGDYNVTVTSDQEDNEPFVFSDVIFTDGAGTVTGVVLTKAHQTNPLLTLQHTLTVVIQSIDDEELVNVNVTAADASHLLITTQPASNEGTYGGTALPVGEVIVETRDEFGNPSVSGLIDPQDVTASISNDASAEGNADLGGDKIIDIQSGTATFSNLTLDKDGIGYTIGFNSTGFDAVVSDPFDMTKVENHIGFDLVDPGPQVVGENFTVRMINARYPDGTLRNGLYEVRIDDVSEIEGLFQGNVNFIDGTTLVTTTDPYIAAGNIVTRFRINNHRDSQKTISVTVSSEDQSGLTITPPGTQTAGTPFDLNITGAKNKAGGDLNGRKHFVTLTSDNLSEGVNGVLFSDSLTFASGAATIADVELFTAGSQDLTVTIDWVTDPETAIVTLEPATATQFVIHQQPVGGEGSNNDVAVGVGEIILRFMDDYGNISGAGLEDEGAATLTVTAAIESGPEGAELGGTIERNIVDGVVIFDGLGENEELTLDKNGSYTLSFTFNGSAPVFDPLVSSSFDMTNIENLEGFDVAHPGKQYQDLPFDLNITNAQDSTGVPLSGDVNVTVTSNKADGVVFNADATFADGEATVTISLNTITDEIEGHHNLTTVITGISGDVVVENVEVAADLSGFTLAIDPVSGPFYQNNPFDLVISGATDLDGVSLTGVLLVTVTSDQADGVVHNEAVNFESGGVSIPITLETVFDSHTLTVEIAGVTESKTVSVNVLTNASGFDLALAETGDKTAGVSFDLDITNANNFSGTAIDGPGHQVTVTSDLIGEFYNNIDVTFTTGAATIPVTLTLAGSHSLTVSVQNITGTEEVWVDVLAATVSMMVIETQPPGGTGTQDDEPAGIGTVVIRTADAFDNFSTVGLSGAQDVTVILQVDGSGLTATLGGNDVVSISSGEAVFDNLTLDYDGTGYVLRFTYSAGEEDPDLELGFLDSDPFDMVDVNSYQISLNASDPLVFATETVGYGSVTATDVQISNTGGGIVTGLVVALSGENPGAFAVTDPVPNSLNPDTEETRVFTVKPNDALGVGSYSAIVTVTADKGVSEQFEVAFEVLPEYDIAITHGVDEPLDNENPLVFESLTEGYGELDYITGTITNTGGTEITGLQVSLGGDNETAFETSVLSPTTVPAGQTATFGIRPVTELAPGSYNATVTIDDHETEPNFSETFNVQFEVIAYTYSISLNPEGPVDFGIRAAGYDAVTPEEITVTRTGTGDITNLSATMSGDAGEGTSDFSLTGPAVTTLDGDPNFTTFTVSPKSDLSAGLYEETVTVKADNSIEVTFNVSFRVVDEVVWEGTTSNWHASGNWSTDAIPDQYAVIRIPSGTSNDPVISGANATVNELVIENGASLTVNSPRRLTINSGGKLTVKPGGKLTSTGTLVNNAGSGGLVVESDDTATGSIIQNSSDIQATVLRYVAGRQWHVISSPVAGLGIQNFIANSQITYSSANSNYAITHYDEKKPGMDFGGWSSYYTSSTGGDMVKGKGYIAGRTENGLFMFSGELTSSNVTIPVTRDANGWNAIGNPFPSAIGARTSASSVQNFIDHNADQLDPDFAAIYIYDPSDGTYKVINNVVSEGFDQDYIQSGQGFLVKSSTGGGNISFTTSMRAHDNSTSFYKKSSNSLWPVINLQVMSDNRNASTLIAFNGSMTRGLDPTYDAGQYGADESFRLYTRLVEEDNGVNMAIQALPDYGFEDMIIPVGFDFAEGGEVTFSAANIRLPTGARAILEDRELDILTDLAHDNYTVVLGENFSGPGRFFVHTDIQITDVEDPLYGEDDTVLNIYSYGKEIFIEGEISENSYAALFDLTGKRIMTMRLQPSERNTFRVDDLTRGIYIIHVSGSGKDRAKRLFIE